MISLLEKDKTGEVRQIVGNTMAQGGGKAVTVVLSLATTAILTRYLGIQSYGQYVFVTAIVLLFSSMSDWGTTIITVREAVANKERRAEIFGSLTMVRLLLAVVAFLAVNVVVRLSPGWREFVSATTWGALVLLFLSLKTSAGIVFHAKLYLKWQAVMEVVSAGVFLGLVWLAALLNGGLVGIVLGWVAATAVAALLGWVVVRRMEHVKWGLERDLAKGIMREAVPTGALLLLFSIYNRVDVLILQHFQGDGSVGIYGLAYKVYDNLAMGAAFLMNAAFPGLAERFVNGDRVALRQRFWGLFKVLLVGGVAVAGFVVVVAPMLVEFLAGAEFGAAGVPLRLLMLAIVFSYLNHLTGYSLIAVGKQRVSLVIAVGALVFNVVLNWWLVPVYSYQAAAVVTGLTEGLVFCLSWLAIGKVLRQT